MKKLKVLLSAVMACVLAFSFVGCASDDDGKKPSGDVLTLSRIAINTDAVKTQYFIGEELNYDGLVVTATYRNETTSSIQTSTVSLSNVVVDSSAFNKDAVGTYSIGVSYTYGKNTADASYTVTVERAVRPYELILDDSSVKKSYNIGDSFDSTGLSATIVYYNYQTGAVADRTDVSDKVKIDSSAFNKDAVGEYSIKVSYQENETTIEATYTVIVKIGAGLDFDIPNDSSDYTVEADNSLTYTLASSGTVVDLSTWVVNVVDANGVVGAEVTDGCTFEAYYGSAENKITVTDKQFIADKAGSYNVWAYYEDYAVPGTDKTFDLSAFVVVNVQDGLSSIEFKSNAAGTLTEQQAGSDKISSTWTFTVHYSSGVSKDITSADVEIEGLDTVTVTNNGVATVTFTELDAKGVAKSVSTTVNYTITEAAQVASGVAGIGFENMTVVTKQAAPYDEATNGTLSIDNSDSILLSSSFIHTTSDSFSIKEVAATIITENGELNLTKALVTEGGSRSTTRRSVEIILPDDGTYTINVWASVVSASNTGRFVKVSNGVTSSYVDFSKAGTQVGNELTVDVQKCTLANVNGGTWYVGGSASIVIHYIEIVKVS